MVRTPVGQGLALGAVGRGLASALVEWVVGGRRAAGLRRAPEREEHERSKDGSLQRRAHGADRTCCPRSVVTGVLLVEPVDHRMTLPALHQPVVDGHRGHERDRERRDQRPPEQTGSRGSAAMAPGTSSRNTVVDDLHGEDRDRVAGERGPHRGPGVGARHVVRRCRSAGSRRRRPGTTDSATFAALPQPHHVAQHHAQDLADRAAGQAVPGRGDRHPPAVRHDTGRCTPGGMRVQREVTPRATVPRRIDGSMARVSYPHLLEPITLGDLTAAQPRGDGLDAHRPRGPGPRPAGRSRRTSPSGRAAASA